MAFWATLRALFSEGSVDSRDVRPIQVRSGNATPGSVCQRRRQVVSHFGRLHTQFPDRGRLPEFPPPEGTDHKNPPRLRCPSSKQLRTGGSLKSHSDRVGSTKFAIAESSDQ